MKFASTVFLAICALFLCGAVLIGEQIIVITWFQGATTGTATLATEMGCDAGTGNNLSVALHFSGVSTEPVCTCMDVNAAAKSCNLTAQPSATAATFIGSGGATDVMCWSCTGLK